ncbi:MAG: hypothetical protein WC719_01005 [Patescibacteria group bacterium]|jgi:hypothetical protein
MISKFRLEQLKIIIKDDYGRDLTDSEAFELGHQLVTYFSGLKKLKLSRHFANMKKHTNQT